MLKLKNLKVGDDEVILLMMVDLTERLTKSGKPYVTLDLIDGERQINAKWFGTAKEDVPFVKGDILEVYLSVEEFGGAPSYIIKGAVCLPEDEAEKIHSRFVKKPPLDIEIMYDEVIDIVNKEIHNEYLKKATLEIYKEYKKFFMYLGAAKAVHHNIYGGLMYHSYRMVKAAVALCEVYTRPNRDLVICGCALHDIGKAVEMETDKFGITTYTVDGNLFGHLLLGRDIVKKECEKINMPKEIQRELEHIIISHHGELEYGAIANPATIEAMMVNRIDDLDARNYIFEDTLNTLDEGKLSDSRVFGLYGGSSFVYKPKDSEK